MPSPRDWIGLLDRVRRFGPGLVLLDNWPAFPFARRLSEALGRPLVYRSQNVEVDYWRGMVGTAHGLRRARLSVNARRIGRLERDVRSVASVVLDISEEDRVRSAALGQEGRSVVLPGTRLPRHVLHVPWEQRDIDVLFAGNLWAPNNVHGLAWFFERVLPAAVSKAPGLRVAVAGARPTPEVRAAALRLGVACYADPPELEGLRSRARVLMNPQLQYGGLMQKMLDYLSHDSWIVTTGVGAAGLTGELPASVCVRDDPEGFAAELVARSADPTVPSGAGASYLEREFGVTRLRESIARIVAATAGGAAA